MEERNQPVWGAGSASHYPAESKPHVGRPRKCALRAAGEGCKNTSLLRQVRDQALAAERAGTARHRAQLSAETATLEARLASDWQRRAAAEVARLESQRAAAAAEAHAAKVGM